MTASILSFQADRKVVSGRIFCIPKSVKLQGEQRERQCWCPGPGAAAERNEVRLPEGAGLADAAQQGRLHGDWQFSLGSTLMQHAAASADALMYKRHDMLGV